MKKQKVYLIQTTRGKPMKMKKHPRHLLQRLKKAPTKVYKKHLTNQLKA